MHKTTDKKYLQTLHDDILNLVTEATLLQSRWESHRDGTVAPESTATIREWNEQARKIMARFTELKEIIEPLLSPASQDVVEVADSPGAGGGASSSQQPMSQTLESALLAELDRDEELASILAEYE